MKNNLLYLIFTLLVFIACDKKDDFVNDESKAVALAGNGTSIMITRFMEPIRSAQATQA